MNLIKAYKDNHDYQIGDKVVITWVREGAYALKPEKDRVNVGDIMTISNLKSKKNLVFCVGNKQERCNKMSKNNCIFIIDENNPGKFAWNCYVSFERYE